KRGPGLLDGTLTVIVRTTERGAESLPVEEDGALPVQAGGIMSLQVQLKQPAFAYLVWIESSAQLLPLYPWNETTLEDKELGQAPPLRKATKILNSPLTVGGGWEFGEVPGMDTVLLLARTTPLPEGTSIAALIGSPPSPVPVRLPG